MSSHPLALTARREFPGAGSAEQGHLIADAAWPLVSALALLAALVWVGVDTPMQRLHAHDVGHGLNLLLRL